MEPRRSTRRQSAPMSDFASGSEYNASSPGEGDDANHELEEPEEVVMTITSRGRRVPKKSYIEDTDEAEEDDVKPEINQLFDDNVKVKNTRAPRKKSSELDDEEGEDDQPRRRLRSTRSQSQNKNLDGFVIEEGEDDDPDDDGAYGSKGRRSTRLHKGVPPPPKPKVPTRSNSTRTTRASQRNNKPKDENDGDYIDGSSQADAEGSDDDEAHLPESDIGDLGNPPEPEPEEEDDNDGKPYALRQRAKVNYAIPPPIEEMKRPPPRPAGKGRGGSKKSRGLGWSASGAELGRWMGMPGDDSDSDHPTRTPRKPFGSGLTGFGSGAAIPAGGLLPGDLAAGTPSNLGKVGDAALADADPLGVNTNVTFDEVGGLDEHIHSLKEMTLLPLLYPEVFQRFSVTPPRGVLFHGPPGTGKTLLARALAASCRSDGRQISFFMRKGADCLSKWVGEAERQLRLLFEEARNSQPSIIFFDEIDGLAPVRSSKQDQIHASIVSTLLALMDGMDGRGQVIVIGATNRPDAVDPALRRPGRFDREFYFGLPGLDAREKILGIMTRKWENWDANSDGEQGRRAKDTLKGLAKLTKGYGGADLRALCTEAALNAIQRRYPQVYKSNDRLLLKPETIDVGLRDFMISIKKIVPSSARSSTSAATTLPPQFEPLLGDTLEQVKATIERVMPIEKKLSALEEAEFEEVGGEDGALEREMLSQSMQTLRIYRPRVVIHGPVGMGQGYIGAAALHHLEGYHIQSLELGSLMSDSTRTVEAAIVQLFTEAKRHQPSVIYIPSLIGWCAAVNETTRSTVRAMLETLLPTDPILLLAVVDGPFSALPKDVKYWFGAAKDNRVQLIPPSAYQRESFFDPLLKDVRRPPNQFADGVKRRKRILEVLPVAPPLAPRKPSAAELALQRENDEKTIVILKFRLGPILAELKRKFKKFTKRATEEYGFEADEHGIGYPYQAVAVTTGAGPATPNHSNMMVDLTQDGTQPNPNGDVHQPQEQAMVQVPPLYDMDLDRMHSMLYKGYYLTPQSFLEDIGKIAHNAEVFQATDLDRFHKAQAMYTAAELSIMEFETPFRIECERMASREMQRREEEHKEYKEKNKGKEKSNGGNGNGAAANGMQTRRSTRQNGGHDLLTVTDPVKLERRLKRNRDSAAHPDGLDGESTGSGEEHIGNEARGAKRSRVVLDEEDEDPMNLTSPSPADRSAHHVRFQNTLPEIVEPSFGGVNGVLASPSPMANYNLNQHGQQYPTQQFPFQQQHQGQQHVYPNQHHQGAGHYPPQPLGQPRFDSVIDPSMGLVPQPQPRVDGFDPMLLNPMSPVLEHQQPSFSSQFGAHTSPQRHDPQQMGHHQFGINPVVHVQSPHHHQQPFNFAGPSQQVNQVNPVQMGYQQSQPYEQHHHQQQGFNQFNQQPQSSQMVISPVGVGHSAPFEDPQNPLYTPPVQDHVAIVRGPHHQVRLQLPQPLQVSMGDSRTPSPPQLAADAAVRATRHSKTPEPLAVAPPEPSASNAGAQDVAGEGKEETHADADESMHVEAPDVPAPEEPVMVVERSPTPPLPDFHVDEGLVEDLARKLKNETEGLTIEQLEQLRATCLGDVWRHRSDWDRDELVKQLFKVVDEFLEEVKELKEWDEED
ncbi:AAA-domain-containing protein [Coprinopsis marcescibilis]|uniref:AAA-domain-containing protein n=1 Tax=Coprinopsis marcescibilis TaxID=230819 RepID=A0A5C3L736_COPMA|nr:AAA-domain-containing protein [Coprinopsis marcescibilis]